MGKAYAILNGLRHVDPTVYDSWDGADGCAGCEQDVELMSNILSPLGYSIDASKTENATRRKTFELLEQAAADLSAGDILVFYYSGHGVQVYDGSDEEDDNQDEAMCLYDGKLLDDELMDRWLAFRPWVRIVTVFDCCNAGTIFKMATHQGPGRNIVKDFMADRASNLKAMLIHMGASKDGDPAPGGNHQGSPFTLALARFRMTALGASFTHSNLCTQVNRFVRTDGVCNPYGPVSAEFWGQKAFDPSQSPGV